MVAAGSMHSRTGGASCVEVDPRAAAPHLAAHGHEVDVARLQVVLGEPLAPRHGGVRAVSAVAPPVERAREPVLARAAALDEPHAPMAARVLECPHAHVVGAHHDHRLVEELVLDEVVRLRDLLEPARHLPHARPQQLDFHLVEVGVEVALLGNAVGKRRVDREGHRECRRLPIHGRHAGDTVPRGNTSAKSL